MPYFTCYCSASDRLTALPTILRQTWRNNKPSSRNNEFQNVSVSSDNCTNRPWHIRQTQGLMDKGRTILHTPLTEHHDRRPFLPHLTLLAFHNDKNKEVDKNDDNFERLENKGSFGYSPCCIFESLQPFWTYGNWCSDCTFPKEGCILAVHPKETQMFRN